MTAKAATLDIDETRAELRGFREFYHREIEPWMKRRGSPQVKARRRAWLVGVPGLIGLPLLFWLLSFMPRWLEDGVVLIAVAYVLGIGGLALWPLRTLKLEVKKFLLDKVCGFFGFTFAQQPSMANFNVFPGTGLLPAYNVATLEDQITGTHGGVKFALLECRLETEEHRPQKEKLQKQVYHGVLFRFTFPKRFAGLTLGVRDKGMIGNFFNAQGKTGERVKLEDPRFEKEFEVWGTDQIEARYLVTPTFMERVVELAKALDEKRVEFCFADNHLLLSIHVRKDQFEGGGIFSSVTDHRRVERLVTELCRVFDIIDTLQLTLKTRI